MTGREFSEVDIDLLADYVGGALDGTPDEAVVAALIADEPGWRTAHESLTAGMLAVGADLRALGVDPAPMPADVVARLSAALSDAALPQPSLPQPTRSEPVRSEPVRSEPVRSEPVRSEPVQSEPAASDAAPAESPATGRRWSVLPGGGSTTAARPAGARRRRPRWVGPVAVAASVLAFAGFGIDRLSGASDRNASPTSAAGDADLGAEANAPMLASAAPAAGTAQGLVAAPPPERVLASDVDYTEATLAAGVRASDRRVPPSDKREPAGQDGVKTESAAGPGLERLGDRTALLDCLRSIAQVLGTGDITVDTVDYARFAGAPALIVRFTAPDGAWAWAAGPDCGTPGSGADTRYRVKVG